MTPRALTEAEYQLLKKKLHQAHDKLLKLTLQEVEAMRELTSIIIMPLLDGVIIDLDSLKLDTTTYIRQNLQAFYSDIVYRAMITDKNSAKPQPANVALLVEHKSDMPKQLAARLQGLDYICAIMKRHYNKDTDKTIPVITIIFNQFNNDWEPETFRSLFPEFSGKTARLIPEFDLLVINLASLPDEILDLLDKYGTLRASLLAMKNVRNKRFLKKHIEEIFVFLQQHPEKTDLRDQLITYLLGQSDLSGQDLEELISNIFSPVLKQEIMISGTGFLAVAAREAAAAANAISQKKAERAAKKSKAAIDAAQKEAQKATEVAQKATEAAQKATEVAQKATEVAQKATEEAEKAKQALQIKARLTVLKSWNKGSSADFIADIVDLSHDEVSQLIAVFENLKTHTYSKTNVDIDKLVKISGLTELEVKTFLIFLT